MAAPRSIEQSLRTKADREEEPLRAAKTVSCRPRCHCCGPQPLDRRPRTPAAEEVGLQTPVVGQRREEIVLSLKMGRLRVGGRQQAVGAVRPRGLDEADEARGNVDRREPRCCCC